MPGFRILLFLFCLPFLLLFSFSLFPFPFLSFLCKSFLVFSSPYYKEHLKKPIKPKCLFSCSPSRFLTNLSSSLFLYLETKNTCVCTHTNTATYITTLPRIVLTISPRYLTKHFCGALYIVVLLLSVGILSSSPSSSFLFYYCYCYFTTLFVTYPPTPRLLLTFSFFSFSFLSFSFLSFFLSSFFSTRLTYHHISPFFTLVRFDHLVTFFFSGCVCVFMCVQ